MFDVSDLIGKPFANKGRGPDAFDCWGVVMEVERRGGNIVPDYGMDALAARLIANVFGNAAVSDCWVQVESPAPMDVVAIKNCESDPTLVNHFGVFLGGGKFIHIMRKTRCSIGEVNSPMWKHQIAGYYRFIG